MPLDFALLSMTELRNRPGEILDRVADKGEAFIIERSGQRKACLVPLSVLLPDIPPARIADEIEQLVQQGEQAATSFTDAKELAFRFPEKLTDGSSAELSIVLPHGYPNNCPRVYAGAVGEGAPHRWADGALCVYGVMTGWNPGKHTVLSTLRLARQWLQNYEAWRSAGQWPKQEGSANE
ncbi:MAG: type II toxin-antitoxin system Phd/YefM family antitoxin [Bryobacteraceae bacterium]|jgi:prevent-host-death family protein